MMREKYPLKKENDKGKLIPAGLLSYSVIDF